VREPKNRAVLFADISESGGLYQKLGDSAARNIVTACLAALKDVLPKYEGELVKTLGDALLCVFPTADLAVLAAGEMQAVVSNERPGNYPVAIHIGLHYGPVFYEKDDIYGDTVNVAAYLTAVAIREQVLTTETTEAALSPALKSCVRPIFNAVLKGYARESPVYQVLWKTDSIEITDVNLHSNKVIPGDTGSLLVSLDAERIRIDQWRPQIVVGRGQDCDLVVSDRYASRQHVTIRLMRTRFYLIDHSINGTYVTLEGGAEVHILRGEIPLDRSGTLCLGRTHGDRPASLIGFNYDRRSMYRI
jgi:class 3 adenylate cyclase